MTHLAEAGAEQSRQSFANQNRHARRAAVCGIVGCIVPIVGWAFVLVGLVFAFIAVLRRQALGLVGLTLCVVAMVGQVAITFVVLNGLTAGRNTAKMAICGTRLKGVGSALSLYAEDNNDSFPALVPRDADGQLRPVEKFDADPKKVVADTKEAAMAELWQSQSDSSLQSFWLLIGHGYCGDDQFQCPMDDEYRSPGGRCVYLNAGEEAAHQEFDETDANAADGRHVAGFDSWYNSSYAFQPTTPHEANAFRPHTRGSAGEMVVAGDRQTGDHAGQPPSSHYPGGGYFLRLNQSVDFIRTELNLVGWKANNVYLRDIQSDGTVLNAGVKRPEQLRGKQDLPVHPNDSVLYWGGKFTPPRLKIRTTTAVGLPFSILVVLLEWLVLAVVFGGTGWIVWRLLWWRRASQKPPHPGKKIKA